MMKTSDLLNVYVLRDSGECVFHQEYGDSADQVKSDSTIMSSFLSAIEMFSNDVDTGADMLETTNYRFVYQKNNHFIYVARTKKAIDPEFYSERLKNIGERMSKYLPKEFDGNVTHFQRVVKMIEEEFFTVTSDSVFEFSGKYARDLKGEEMKIYSYLRLKGQANLRTISKMMSIPENRVHKITDELVNQKYLLSKN